MGEKSFVRGYVNVPKEMRLEIVKLAEYGSHRVIKTAGIAFQMAKYVGLILLNHISDGIKTLGSQECGCLRACSSKDFLDARTHP